MSSAIEKSMKAQDILTLGSLVHKRRCLARDIERLRDLTLEVSTMDDWSYAIKIELFIGKKRRREVMCFSLPEEFLPLLEEKLQQCDAELLEMGVEDLL